MQYPGELQGIMGSSREHSQLWGPALGSAGQDSNVFPWRLQVSLLSLHSHTLSALEPADFPPSLSLGRKDLAFMHHSALRTERRGRGGRDLQLFLPGLQGSYLTVQESQRK